MLDLDQLEELSKVDNGYTCGISGPDLRELVNHARENLRHRDERDLWQEIGRIEQRLDELESS